MNVYVYEHETNIVMFTIISYYQLAAAVTDRNTSVLHGGIKPVKVAPHSQPKLTHTLSSNISWEPLNINHPSLFNRDGSCHISVNGFPIRSVLRRIFV